MVSITPVLAILLLLLSTSAAAEVARVAITQIVEHPSLDAARRGIADGLREAGFTEGDNLELTWQSAQGNPATAVQIARTFAGDAPDVIVAIATPAAQAAAAATRDIPVVFSAVSDPVGARLVRDPAHPGGNVTGVSDLSPIAAQLDLIREITPAVKTLGVVYNPGEANSVTLVGMVKALAPERGLRIVEAAAPRSGEVLTAARSLAGRADAIYVPLDNTVASALEGVIR
ncbi:MAG: ABC transporter substrate-binding protein, partial [Pseudomonadota bacterium]|nr:ABC transporter substrate-binding protein [Pseudomonadota bacterium]